jgi:regulator of protease activity HflC (stomatin/prohibitin superfamily)
MKYFTKENWTDKYDRFRGLKLAIHVVIGLVILLLVVLQFPFGTVGAGERGVQLQFNAVTGKVFGEGLYLRMPFVQKVKIVDVKIQKEQVDADAASKDLQIVKSTVALNFHLNPEQVSTIYKEVGILYKERLIDPAIQESVKASTSKFTAEELITKREFVREEVKTLLKNKMSPLGIVVDEFNIVNFDFSRVFNEAIEAKVTAEQNAFAARNKLEQIKYEAQQRVEEAKGKAEAITIESKALMNNPQVLELRALEKWNGVLPQVVSDAIPFINIK